MSKTIPKHAYAKEILESFEGMGESLSMEKKKTSEIINFRILDDGSLEKREGWEEWLTLPDRVLCFWEGSADGEDFCFAVTSDRIFRIRNGVAEDVGSLPDSTDQVSFFSYRNRVYLLTGQSICIWRPESNCFATAQGYAPLLGVGWHPRTMGKSNEAVNLFCNRARVQYVNVSGETVFHLPLFASHIDHVLVDGVSRYDFVLNTPANEVTLQTTGASVEIAFTFHKSYIHSDIIHQSIQSFCDVFGKREKLLLGGSSYGQRVYCAANVPDESLVGSSAIYPESDPLYFRENEILLVGDTLHPMTSFVRERDRVLAFSTRALYSIELSTSDDAAECRVLRVGMGCLSRGVSVTADGDPVILNENGVFTLHAPSGSPDAFVATKISATIPELENDTLAKNAIVTSDPSHNEIWIRSKIADDSRVWIYNVTRRKWYCFDGIRADLFCAINGRVGFVCGERICRFDESLCTDQGEPFEAVFRTPYLSFGDPEQVKRGLRFSIKCETGGNLFHVLLESETRRRAFNLQETPRNAPTLFDRRAALGRFHFLRVSISDVEHARSRIYRLGLYAYL